MANMANLDFEFSPVALRCGFAYSALGKNTVSYYAPLLLSVLPTRPAIIETSSSGSTGLGTNIW